MALNMVGKMTVSSFENGSIPLDLVFESSNSVIEAAPVSSLFENGRIDHLRRFEEVYILDKTAHNNGFCWPDDSPDVVFKEYVFFM